MEKKYEFTGETREYNGKTLHRIKAIRDFSDIADGDLGGWIEKEENLSHDGNCWVYDDSEVCAAAKIIDNSRIMNNSRIIGKSIVRGNVCIDMSYIESSQISHKAYIYASSIASSFVGGKSYILDSSIEYSNIVDTRIEDCTIDNSEVHINNICKSMVKSSDLINGSFGEDAVINVNNFIYIEIACWPFTIYKCSDDCIYVNTQDEILKLEEFRNKFSDGEIAKTHIAMADMFESFFNNRAD